MSLNSMCRSHGLSRREKRTPSVQYLMMISMRSWYFGYFWIDSAVMLKKVSECDQGEQLQIKRLDLRWFHNLHVM